MLFRQKLENLSYSESEQSLAQPRKKTIAWLYITMSAARSTLHLQNARGALLSSLTEIIEPAGTRRSASIKSASPLRSAWNCLGCWARDNGQSLEPEPPAKITGMITDSFKKLRRKAGTKRACGCNCPALLKDPRGLQAHWCYEAKGKKHGASPSPIGKKAIDL